MSLKLLLLFSVIVLSGCVQPGADVTARDYCEVDSDCVPATCCHPSRTVNKAYAPDCSAVSCTAVCQGPLDCGAGEPACVDNKCDVRQLQEPF